MVACFMVNGTKFCTDCNPSLNTINFFYIWLQRIVGKCPLYIWIWRVATQSPKSQSTFVQHTCVTIRTPQKEKKKITRDPLICKFIPNPHLGQKFSSLIKEIFNHHLCIFDNRPFFLWSCLCLITHCSSSSSKSGS